MISREHKFNISFVLLFLLFNCSSLTLIGQNIALDDIRKLKNEGEYNAALNNIKLELNRDQNDSVYAELIYNLADIYLTIQEFDSAISRIKTLIKLYPEKFIYYDMISYAYWAIGNRGLAIEFSKEAYKLDSTNALALNNLSYYLAEAGYYKEGIYYANLGLKQKLKSENKALLLNNRGLGYLGLGMYEEALSDINLAIKFNPKNPYAYYYRSLAKAGLGDFETVCEDLAKAKELGGINLTKDAIKKYCGE